MEIEEVKNEIKNLGFNILREEKIGDNIVIDFVDKSIKHELEPYGWFVSSISFNPSTKELEATIRKKINEYANAEIFCDDELFIPHIARYKEDDEIIFSLNMRLKENSLERFMDILNSIVVSSS
jgi:carbonic anhydrase